MFDAPQVCALIAQGRFNLGDEKACQQEIDAFLRARAPAGVEISREHRLSDRDVPDFLIDRRIAVEVKIKGARKKAVFKQLRRYAEHDQVESVVLVTSLSMGLPREVEGKPAYYVSLGRAWL